MRLVLFALRGIVVFAGCKLTEPSTCVEKRLIRFNQAVTETLEPADCEIDGARGDRYQFEMTTAGVVHFLSVTTAITSAITVNVDSAAPDDRQIASDGGETRYDTYVALPIGHYSLRIFPGAPSERGAYQETATLVTGAVDGCMNSTILDFVLSPGVLVPATLTASDCPTDATGAQHFDIYEVRLVTGRTYTLTADATMPITLGVQLAGVSKKSQTTTVAGVTSYTYTAATTGYHTITVSGTPSAVNRTYSLRVD